MHKYVIISITYLTPKPVKVCLGSQSLRLCIREDGGRHRPKTLPPTPFPDDASNQATCTSYIKIPDAFSRESDALQGKSGRFFRILAVKRPKHPCIRFPIPVVLRRRLALVMYKRTYGDDLWWQRFPFG